VFATDCSLDGDVTRETGLSSLARRIFLSRPSAIAEPVRVDKSCTPSLRKQPLYGVHRRHRRKGHARPLNLSAGAHPMPSIETYRKQAKQLVRWHRQRNYSVGDKVRLLERYRDLNDAAVLDMAMPLTLAQEIIAVEAGFKDWTALRQATDGLTRPADAPIASPRLASATPILFVRDVAVAAEFYQSKLGFEVDFLHGSPAFYGAISRDGACLHLRSVHRPNFGELAEREVSLILATIVVSNVKALFAEYEARGVGFPQRLERQAWGGLDFHVRDPDGNRISFVEYRTAG
jgi:uncharacterized glyoxalase superfamily protein PhnB